MLIAIKEDGSRGRPGHSSEPGRCPVCSGSVSGRCGDIVPWHWAHQKGQVGDVCRDFEESRWHLSMRLGLVGLRTDLLEPIENGRRLDLRDTAGDVILVRQSAPSLPEARAETCDPYWVVQGHADDMGVTAIAEAGIPIVVDDGSGYVTLRCGGWRQTTSLTLFQQMVRDRGIREMVNRHTPAVSAEFTGTPTTGLWGVEEKPEDPEWDTGRAKIHEVLEQQSLSDDVRNVLTLFLEKPEVSISGMAGTGKTTLTDQIIRSGAFPTVHLLAPTGRAARRMTEVTGRGASTIHSAIYGTPQEDPHTKELKWPEARPIGVPGDLIVVDEISMVGASLMWDLRSAAARGVYLLLVGDHRQLPPVNDAPAVHLENADVQLTKIWRTSKTGDAGVQINEFAHAILDAKTPVALSQLLQRAHRRWPKAVHHSNGWAPGTWVAGMQNQDKWTSALITFANSARHVINFQAREALGYESGDFADGRELLLVRSNHRELGLLNGDIVRYLRCIDEEDPDLPPHLTYALLEDTVTQRRVRAYLDMRSIFLDPQDSRSFREARREDSMSWLRTMIRGNRQLHHPRWRAQRDQSAIGQTDQMWGPAGLTLHVQLGYALTGHGMQGSEADIVGIYWDEWYRLRSDLEDTRAWWYTCVTRARRSLVLFLPGVAP